MAAPVNSIVNARMKPSPATATATDARVNILVVDDLQEKHVVFGSILEELGQNVVSARSGKEALRFVLEMDFAVILLDVNMPDIDGLETARLLRQYKRTSATPILFITAYVDEVQATRGYALGAVDYIPSPVVPEILRSKVKVFVDLYRMNRQLKEQAAEREALARSEAALAAAEEASRRADYLADASQALSRSLNTEDTIQALFQVTVPALADMAVLAIVNAEGDVVRTELNGVDAADAAHHASRALHDDMHQTVRVALATRQVQFQSRPVLWEHSRGPQGDKVVRLPSEVETAAVYPLFTGDRVLGALVLVARNERFDAAAVSLLREVVSRASIALENARLYSAVQDADRRKNEFLAMLAHELRNPLAPIRNAVHIIHSAGVAEPKVTWARDVIGRQVDHMARMIDDLLDVSRIASGKITVRTEKLTLATVFERAIEASGPLLAARDQVLAVELPPESVELDGDVVRLAQVLSNLLNNASKFTGAHGRIVLKATCDGSEVTISVKDDGEGIAPAFLPHIFELFVQADQSLDRSQGGLGIGLTLVRHLVELHGGRVHAASGGAGLGTEVFVCLPARIAQHAEAVRVANEARPERAGGVPVRILVVDDLAASADTLMMFLESEGFAVTTANDGMTALKVAAEFRPDVVLLDIGLPGMNGFEVAHRMRQQPHTRGALIIALTGYGEAESRFQSVEAGFDHYMVKPADIDQLLSIIADPDAARKANTGSA
jgi:signal transduction histidine kinase/DNA-binding response OmpR family regulator